MHSDNDHVDVPCLGDKWISWRSRDFVGKVGHNKIPMSNKIEKYE